MSKKFSFILMAAALFLSLACGQAHAEEGTLTAEATNPPSAGRLIAKLEVRPTWATSVGSFESQNQVDIGYQFESDRRIFLVSNFNANLYHPANAPGMNVKTPEGRLEFDLDNLWTDRRRGLALDYQPRLHIPTDTTKTSAGHLTELRNQVNFHTRLNNRMQLLTSSIPAFHVYSKAGEVVDNTPTANPIFDHRLEIGPVFDFADRWKLGVPLRFDQTKYANYRAGAKFNDSWSFKVSFKPELTFNFSQNLLLGVAFETDNLVADNMANFETTSGFQKGLAQFIMVASL